jgi:hypothetical protein
MLDRKAEFYSKGKKYPLKEKRKENLKKYLQFSYN